MEKTLTVERVAWSDDAARYLAGAIVGEPCCTVADFQRELEENPDCGLYRVADGAELVGFVLVRVERFAGGAEGVIVAAAGRLAGARLYGQVLPALERLFHGVSVYRVQAFRGGAVRALERAGYLATHVVMRKAAPLRVGDDVLEALQGANVEALGGPDLRARPGKLHGGGGKSSSASSQVTTQVDRRIVADAGGIGINADNSTVTVSDHGAISGALALVDASDQRAYATLNDLLGVGKGLFELNVAALDKAGERVAAAYDQARGEATQKNLVAGAALAVVAVVAIKVLK